MVTWIALNVLAGFVGAIYMAADLGLKTGKAINRKLHGKRSPYNEIVTVKRGRNCIK